MAQQTGRSKTPDTRPARKRYWDQRRLEESKVKNLMQSNGMSEREAREFWRAARANRRTPWGGSS